MYHVFRNVNQVLEGLVGVGVFSFCVSSKTLYRNSEHGNLMISCVSFVAVPSGNPKPDAWQVP